MNGLTCPHCGEHIYLFKSNGGKSVANKENLRLLASLPFEGEIVKQGDEGSLLGLYDDTLNFTRNFKSMVDQIEVITKMKTTVPVREQRK